MGRVASSFLTWAWTDVHSALRCRISASIARSGRMGGEFATRRVLSILPGRQRRIVGPRHRWRRVRLDRVEHGLRPVGLDGQGGDLVRDARDIGLAATSSNSTRMSPAATVSPSWTKMAFIVAVPTGWMTLVRSLGMILPCATATMSTLPRVAHSRVATAMPSSDHNRTRGSGEPPAIAAQARRAGIQPLHHDSVGDPFRCGGPRRAPGIPIFGQQFLEGAQACRVAHAQPCCMRSSAP